MNEVLIESAFYFRKLRGNNMEMFYLIKDEVNM
jgi:hypothetical protein